MERHGDSLGDRSWLLAFEELGAKVAMQDSRINNQELEELVLSTMDEKRKAIKLSESKDQKLDSKLDLVKNQALDAIQKEHERNQQSQKTNVAATEFVHSSKSFSDSSSAVESKMCCENCKMNMIIASIVLLILLVVAAVLYYWLK